MEVTKMRIVSLFTFAIFLVAAGLTHGRPAQAQIAGPEKVGACQSNGGRPAPGSCQNFMAGQKDVNGKFIGGTEMRYLIEHTIPHGDPFNGGTCAAAAGCPALFAFNAYWEDVPGSLEGYGHRCAQALVLSTPVWNGGAWKEDADFGNSEGGACPFSPRTPRGVALATAAAFDKTFTTYGDGSATPGGGISELIVGLWSTLYIPGCRGTPAVVANRVDSSGKWPWTQLACDFAPGGTPSLSQVRHKLLRGGDRCNQRAQSDFAGGMSLAQLQAINGHISITSQGLTRSSRQIRISRKQHGGGSATVAGKKSSCKHASSLVTP
jgi:hypothetical protein